MQYGIKKLIDDSIMAGVKETKKRTHLGASSIGDGCKRKVWYQFYQPIAIEDPRIHRIFELGHVTEDHIVIPMLKKAGLTVYEKDDDGNQFGFKDGNFAGSCDGVVVGLPESSKPHVLEVKSANKSRFNQFVKEGYRSSETYWVQVQIYMHYLELKDALAVVYCKDNSELYFERIKYDRIIAEMANDKAHDILDNPDTIPDRAYKKSSFFKCRFCNHNKICWEE